MTGIPAGGFPVVLKSRAAAGIVLENISGIVVWLNSVDTFYPVVDMNGWIFMNVCSFFFFLSFFFGISVSM